MAQLGANIEVIQGRCLSCDRSIETEDSRTLGIGPDCEKAVARMFDSDRLNRAENKITKNCTLFNLLTTFGRENQDAKIADLALALINATSGADLTWSLFRRLVMFTKTLRDAGLEQDSTSFLDALQELAPLSVQMARGQISEFLAQLTFNETTQRGELVACTKRKASQLLALLPGAKRQELGNTTQDGKRFSYRQWSFQLSTLVEVGAIVDKYWPLAEVSSAFLEAKYRASLLPKEPEKKALGFEKSSPLEDFFVYSWQRQRQDGSWLFQGDKYRASEEIRNWLLSEDTGAAYYKKGAPSSLHVCYLVPENKAEELEAKLSSLFDGVSLDAPTKAKRNGSTSSYSRGYRRSYR